MTGASLCLGLRAAIGARLGSLLWLVTALSVLQWTPATVDPSYLVRLLAGQPGHAGLAVSDHSSSPAIEARAPASTTLAEKRSSAGRSLPVAAGFDATAVASVRLPANEAAAQRVAAIAPASPQTRVHWAFTARSPPHLG